MTQENTSTPNFDFKLIAVKCKNCDSGLVVEVNDNITYCMSCGSGFEIIVDGELIPIEINFAAATIRGNGEPIYKPFWLLKTTVTIHERNALSQFTKEMQAEIFSKIFLVQIIPPVPAVLYFISRHFIVLLII